jgi:diguanylate cyclase
VKQWVVKLIEQFESDRGANASITANLGDQEISEDRATLLYLIDIYNKNLIEFDKQPVRKVREILDEFTKAILNKNSNIDKVLFRFRQFFSSYRVEEYTYIQNTFNDFKHIIWDFADQLSEDIRFEQSQDIEVKTSLGQLREAVEANSIDDLKVKSREFIDYYVEQQTKRDERRSKSLSLIKTNLDHVKKKLASANQKMQVDHLTKAFNRMSFDEHAAALKTRAKEKNISATLVYFDLDHFKKVNDTFGHDSGDVVLQECVKLIKKIFSHPTDFVARIGGEEFAILLENCTAQDAILRADEALRQVRDTPVVHNSFQIRYTISMGIAELSGNETVVEWVKRADSALYQSKTSGRDRYTLAPPGHLRVA